MNTVELCCCCRPSGRAFKDLIGKPLIDKFYNGAQPIDQFVLKIQTGNTTSFTAGGGTATLQGLIMTSHGFIPFEDGATFKEITPENYVEGPMMFIKTISIISCGAKAGGQGLIILLPMLQPILRSGLSRVIKYYNRFGDCHRCGSSFYHT